MAAKALETGAPRFYSDSATYLIAADGLRAFIESSGSTKDFRIAGLFIRGPLYPFFLTVTGDGLQVPDTVTVLAQVVLNVLMIWLVYLLGTMLLGRIGGVIAAALTAVFPILVDLPSVVLTEPVRAPAIVGTLLSLAHFRRQKTLGIAITAGFLVALLAVSHSSAFLLPLPLLLWVAFCAGRVRRRVALLLIAPLGLTLSLWVFGTLMLFGHVLVPGQGGLGFGGGGGWTAFVSSRPSTNGQYLATDYELVEPTLYPELVARVNAGEVEPEITSYVQSHSLDVNHPIPDSVFWDAYVSQARSNPLGFIRITAIKGWRLIMDPWVVLPPDASFLGASFLGYIVLHFFAALGLCWPRGSPDLRSRLLLVSVPAYFVGIFSLTTPEGRYWWPVLPVVIILAAAGMVRTLQLSRAMIAWLQYAGPRLCAMLHQR